MSRADDTDSRQRHWYTVALEPISANSCPIPPSQYCGRKEFHRWLIFALKSQFARSSTG
jgi:hypothetical protein